MKILLYLLLLLGPKWTGSTCVSTPLSAEARAVQKAYLALKANPIGAQERLNYLKAFPKSKVVFLRVFVDEPRYEQLAGESFDYITALENIGKTQPSKVLSICIGLGKKLVWDADAVNFLQKAAIDIGIAHPKTFAYHANILSPAEQKKLSAFLAGGAEGENLALNKFRIQLTKVGASKLTEQLRQAQARQLRQPH